VGANVSDLGEFGLIERLLARLGTPGEGVVVGPGDDAAAVRLSDGATALATADLLLEGVHFEIGLSSPADVGWKALAVNLSDIAAMGGVPRFALVSLGAPAATAAATLEQIYAGLDECARAFGVSVVGGDTVRTDRLIVSVAVIGEVGEFGVLRRAGATTGDVVCVTGAVGGAAAGLALLRAAGQDERAASLLARFPALAEAHRRPGPRVREGLAAARAGATALIDISDGLGADVGHICEASAAGASLAAESIPRPEGLAEVARWAGVDPLAFAVAGGDDYELAIAVPAERLDALRTAVAPTTVTEIGAIVDGMGVRLERGGEVVELATLGWDHFGGEA
jgi:thiamine-monophosphate kinase